MICDTGGLLNGLIAGQKLHVECLEAINGAPNLVLSPLVLRELDYLVTTRHGGAASARLLNRLTEPEYELATFGDRDLASAIEVMTTYRDLDLGLTDASLVVLAKRYETHDILTLDQRHFRVVRSLDGRPFRLFPYDAD